jgi:hypothetical protein
MYPQFFAPSSLAQWVAAIATSTAVIIALFKDSWVRYFRRPKLSVQLRAGMPDFLMSQIDVKVSGNTVWRGDCYWVRLWVENVGKTRAEQVQVFAAKLSKRDATNKFVPVPGFIPMNLRWANARDWRDPEIFAPGISNGMGKHCDLLSVSDPENPTNAIPGFEGKAVPALIVESYPPRNQHRIPPGEYRLKIMIGASNAEPVEAHVSLNLKGEWSADQEVMFRDYAGIQICADPE